MYMYMYSAYIRVGTCILIHMQYTDILLCTYSDVHLYMYLVVVGADCKSLH